jgi:hypothetical protein
MCGDDDRLSLGMEFLKKMNHFFSIYWIEIPRRFIGNDNIRMMDEGSCDRGALEFSSGEGFYEFVFFREKSYLREDFWYPCMDRLGIIS